MKKIAFLLLAIIVATVGVVLAKISTKNKEFVPPTVKSNTTTTVADNMASWD